MAEFDTVIRGGAIIDGLRTPRYTGDIGIKDGRIAYMGRLSASDGDNVIDADGFIVAPGFVDMHTHYDGQVFWDPYCTMSAWHGITSVVVGNCGFSFAPVEPEMRERAMLMLSRTEAIELEALQAGMPWDWVTFPEYMDSLEGKPKGVNVASYCGVSPLMMSTMGLEAGKSRTASADEITKMCALFDEALDAGAVGWSAQWAGQDSGQRDYDGTAMLSDLMSVEQAHALCEVLARRGQGMTQINGHGAGESYADVWARHEKLAEISGRPVIHNVIEFFTGVDGKAHGNYVDTIEWLAAANARGNRVFGQAVTAPVAPDFTFEDFNLFDRSPIWREATLGTVPERMAKLADPERRTALKAEFDAGDAPAVTFSGTMDDLVIAEVENPSLKHYEGLSVREITELDGKHTIDAMLDITVADELKSLFHTPVADPDAEAAKLVLRSPFAIPGVSDGGAHTKFLTLGSYPTYLIARLARDNDVMDLEEAHWRLSAYPAQVLGFKDRGWLREGAAADIVIYDIDNLSIRKRERLDDQPAGAWRRVQKADGYKWILVNGEVTFQDGECTGATPGGLLRNGEVRSA